MPQIYEIKAIEHEMESINKYHVLFWYRLLRNIYQNPLEMECDLLVKDQEIDHPETAILRRSEESEWQILNTSENIIKKIQSQEIKPFPVNWKYFIRLPSGGTIEIGSKDRNTTLFLAHVIIGQLKNEDDRQAKKFISLLLEEAEKEERNKLFDPLKEFERIDGLKVYQLFNVYRANYVSAEFMFKQALDQEEVLREEILKYDTRTSDYFDEEKMKHCDQFMLAKGMYFLSAITFYFMALEGFINIIFHSFLKENLRGRDLNIEQRFDIEQKLKLMPALCNGFNQEPANSTDSIYLKFLKLKKSRNSIFHSKVEDALKSFVFVESGFFYTCNLDKYKQQFLPVQKLNLSADDVIEVKVIVDSVIEMILNSMTDDTRGLTEKHILESTHIPFFILDDGSLSLGASERKQKGNNLAQQNSAPDSEELS